MKSTKRILSGLVFVVLSAGAVHCAEISRSFELRYVSWDPKADGETDFKGETSVFDTARRVEFLKRYADYARYFFNDPGLDREIVSDGDVREVLAGVKPRPLPSVRKSIPLDEWKWLGYRDGQVEESMERLSRWENEPGATVRNGALLIEKDDTIIRFSMAPQRWRFSLRLRVMVPSAGPGVSFRFGNAGEEVVLSAGFRDDGKIFFTSGGKEVVSDSFRTGLWSEVKFEVDLSSGRYNFYVNGGLSADFVPLRAGAVETVGVDTFCVRGGKGVLIDDIWGVGYSPTDDVKRPFTIRTFLDESFEVKPAIEGWSRLDYDDGGWETASLPLVHGGERHAGEDLYLRRVQHVGDFSRAVLDVETLDPEGEIWINGRIAAVLPNRHPAVLDIGRYLKKNAENIIAVRVYHFNIEEYGYKMMGHTPLDLNIGWFAGRMSLELTADTYVEELFVFTEDVSDPAVLRARVKVCNEGPLSFEGKVVVSVFPWYPEESDVPAATAEFPVTVGSGVVEFSCPITVPRPKLWTWQTPNLYRVRAVLEDGDGAPVDDYVITTGIRTVGQEGGTFRVNGKPEMLNGAQIFGFRAPIEKLVVWNRSCPVEWLVKEILMIKRMNGNLMRIHVHAWGDPARNINDPRLAELGDQLGIMFIWATPAWIRTGRGWGEIDFEGYPKYMKQVRNHPSIVMWEVSNHPNAFKKRGVEESNLFCEKAYEVVHSADPSRLISFTSHIRHLHYGNDAGTMDQEGNPIEPSPAWTAPMVTRGNQDSVTGYGKEWSVLRTWPPEYQRSFLDSRERAYFNFEHEESIGQPNWNLVKGKPWYRLQSYEWGQDEGSIGRKLTADEWMESQAWQAFSAYESMKKQRILDYDGFSWCCLHGGPNSVTYKKPLVDYHGRAKLAYYANKMVFQRVLAGSGDVDVVYGPGDVISPVVLNLGDERTVELTVEIRDMEHRVVDRKVYPRVVLPAGRAVARFDGFRPSFPREGCYAVEYTLR